MGKGRERADQALAHHPWAAPGQVKALGLDGDEARSWADSFAAAAARMCRASCGAFVVIHPDSFYVRGEWGAPKRLADAALEMSVLRAELEQATLVELDGTLAPAEENAVVRIAAARVRAPGGRFVGALLVGQPAHTPLRAADREGLLSVAQLLEENLVARQNGGMSTASSMPPSSGEHPVTVLAEGLGHAFNNMLMKVQIHAEEASATLDANAPAAERLRQIESVVAEMATLTRGMLGYAGKLSLDLRPTALNQVVRDALVDIEDETPANVHLSVELTDVEVTVRVGPGHIRQALHAVVRNAIEAIGESAGHIVIKTAHTASFAELSIRDSGPGVSELHEEQIFDPFFTTKFPGRGLSLATVRSQLEQLGGHIALERQPNAGAIFRIELPVVETAKATLLQTRQTESTVANRRKRTALVVDDEAVICRSVARMLRREGYEVLTAGDGEEGMRHINDATVDLVLLDWMTPGLSGAPMIEALRTQLGSVPIVVMSGHGESDVIREAGGRHHDAFLPKPFRVQSLLDTIASVTVEEDAN